MPQLHSTLHYEAEGSTGTSVGHKTYQYKQNLTASTSSVFIPALTNWLNSSASIKPDLFERVCRKLQNPFSLPHPKQTATLTSCLPAFKALLEETINLFLENNISFTFPAPAQRTLRRSGRCHLHSPLKRRTAYKQKQGSGASLRTEQSLVALEVPAGEAQTPRVALLCPPRVPPQTKPRRSPPPHPNPRRRALLGAPRTGPHGGFFVSPAPTPGRGAPAAPPSPLQPPWQLSPVPPGHAAYHSREPAAPRHSAASSGPCRSRISRRGAPAAPAQPRHSPGSSRRAGPRRPQRPRGRAAPGRSRRGDGDRDRERERDEAAAPQVLGRWGYWG